MADRGFGLEVEDTYGDTTVSKSNFDPDFWNNAESIDFKLNDDPVVKSGGSRMNRKARAGVMKPSGSTSAEADLQQLTWYFFGALDNYKHTTGPAPSTGHTQTHIHEFYGGEGKSLPSFRAIAVFDMIKKYLYGLTCDGMSLEVADDSMSVGADWIYKTEKAGIIGKNSETFSRPSALTKEDIFVMFYDISIKLNGYDISNPTQGFGGIATQLKWELKNNHNVDSTIGFGARYPQRRANAGKRENSLEITTTLTEDTAQSILNAQYGEVGALEPTGCKLLQIPLEINIAHCEDSDLACKILFPKCTVRVEYDLSGVDEIEAKLTLDTLGTGQATLANNNTVATDVYVKLTNYVASLSS